MEQKINQYKQKQKENARQEVGRENEENGKTNYVVKEEQKKQEKKVKNGRG